MTRISTVAVLLLTLVGWCKGQEHPFLSRFELSEGNGQVLLDWTMVTGNTCDGTTILRSLNGTDFHAIGMLGGLCGSITEPVDYRFVDVAPPELQQVHYRLELGTNGSSSIRTISLMRLFSAEHRVQPSPVTGNGVLLLRVPVEEEVALQVWSANGTKMYEANGRGGRHVLPAETWPAGIYLYKAAANGRTFVGRFVVV